MTTTANKKSVKSKESEKAFAKIKKDSLISEAYFTALLWSNPDNYSIYEEIVNINGFMNPAWKYFYSLGRELYKRGFKIFDEVTVFKVVSEYVMQEKFNSHGGYEVVSEIIDEVRDYEENIDTYCEEINKNALIKSLEDLFGDKIFKEEGKYDWSKMSKDQLLIYWSDKLNQISMQTGNKFDEQNMIEDPANYIAKVESQSETGLPLYKSKLMNSITNGVHQGHVIMFGGFGNAGKTSIVFNKYVMSSLVNREKLAVIANEEEIKSFQDKMVITVISHELGEGFDRKILTKGGLTDEDKDVITRAFERVREMTDGDDALVKFIFMEDYIMNDVKKVVKHYHNRGYVNFLIDTHKVSEQSGHKERWHTFVEDMKTIYKLTRSTANGLNLRMWVNFQLVDSAIKNRYLDFEAIGEGKAAKNEASVVMMVRTVWADEYEGGNHEIQGFRYVPDKINGGYKEKKFTLEKGKTYYLLFTPKNRFNSNNDNGMPVLILEPNFNYNSFNEIGWTFIANDKSR